MKDFIGYRNRIMLASAALAGVVALVLLECGMPAAAIGVAVGAAGSIAKFWLGALKIMKLCAGAGDSGRALGRAVRGAMSGFALRFVVIAAVLAVGYFVPQISFIATAAAVFTTNFVLIAAEFGGALWPSARRSIIRRFVRG
jgi:hypothetical protein